MTVNPKTGEVLEECDFSGLAKEFCAHCKGDTLGDEKTPEFGNGDVDDFEIIGRVFEAQYHGVCTINYDHKVRRGDRVAKVQRADNPMLPVSGVACKDCVKLLPHA